MQKIYFRADASPTIGYGHFIRTLALADMLKDDFECVFVTQFPTDDQKSEVAKVCELLPVPATNEKFGLFLEMLRGDEIVVFDNYFFTTDYQRAIKKKGCRLVCIDDMHDKHYVADVVINHGQTNPALFDVESYTRLCLEFDWALLRRPFLEAAKMESISSDRIEKVVVCFGGSDIHDITGYFVNQVLRLCTVNSITAVVGDAYTPHSSCVQDSRLICRSHLTAQEMADLFCDSDLVICSASSVCMEALACGAKVAAGWYVDNQKEFYDLLIPKNTQTCFKKKDLSLESTYMTPFNYWVLWKKAMNFKIKLRKFYDSSTTMPNINDNYILFPLHYQPEQTISPTGGLFVNQLLAIEMLLKYTPINYYIM